MTFLQKGANKVLTCINNEGLCEWREISGNGSEIYTFNCELRGNAWGYGHFYKIDINADNSSTKSLTSQYDNIPQNLYMSPFVAPANIKIIRITGTIYYCSVHAEQPTYPCYMRLRFQKNLSNTRQQIGDVLVQVQQANNWSNQNNLVYQQVSAYCENQNLIINQGENWGVEFIGEQASNRIIQIRGVFLQIVARKI
ncbi:MAG: hypothetical protein RMJ67_06420 [Elusimicrobiota bacterium]|nr:hypothetical protein [Endomicrobiia bacterium]MDW8166128.1 hypothetical protein [Elusimicrobiota bacterium]